MNTDCEYSVKDRDEDYIRDGLGWIDDPRAPAGHVGLPFTRQLHLHALLNEDLAFTLEKLCEHQYNKDEVRVVLNMILDQAYNDSR
jgi:hypothetical protein